MIYTAKETMAILKIADAHLYKLLKTGELKGFKVGRDWKIPEKSIENWIQKKMEERA